MSGYIGQAPVVQATQTRQSFTATANQTSFSTLGYQENHLDVFLNGVKLNAADYTATNNSDIVLAAGCAVNDILEMVAFGTFEVANQSFTGTTVINTLTVTNDGTGSNIDADQLDGQHGAYYTGYTDTQLAALVDSSPAALNTLNELAAALGDDANFSTTVTNSIATKLPLAGGTLTGDLTLDSSTHAFLKLDKGASGDYALTRYYTAGTEGWRTGTYNDGTSYVIGTPTDKRLLITTDGNVGIGDPSPSSLLSITKNSARTNDFENMLKITHSSSNTTVAGFGSAIYFVGERNNGANQAMGRLVFDAEVNSGTNISSGFSVQTATAGSPSEKFRITHDGNVGIGTSSPARLAEIYGTTNPALRLNNGTANVDIGIATSSGALLSGSSANDLVIARNGAYNIKIGTNGTTRMTLDASGNVLVGTNDDAAGAGNSTTGISLRGGTDNRSFFSVNQSYVMHLNRKGNDGDILKFAKDGGTVGSIGSQGGDLNIGTGACGIAFVDGVPAIYPWTTTGNTTRDAAIDLGDSGGRFKDLYLSGGVYLGGTGADNKLTDYEEGDYTPAKNNGGSVSYSAQGGHYTKVGELVTVYMDMTISSASGESGATIVTLPFTSKSGDNYMTFNPWIVETGFTGSSETASGFVNGGTSVMFMYKITSGNSSGAGYINNNATGRWSGVFTYFAA